MKKFITFLCTCTLILTMSATVFAEQYYKIGLSQDSNGEWHATYYPEDPIDVPVFLNGRYIHIHGAARIIDGTIMLSSQIFEYMGANIIKNSDSDTLVTRESNYIRLLTGQNIMDKNGVSVEIKQAPRIIDGVLFTPLAEAVDGLGLYLIFAPYGSSPLWSTAALIYNNFPSGTPLFSGFNDVELVSEEEANRMSSYPYWSTDLDEVSVLLYSPAGRKVRILKSQQDVFLLSGWKMTIDEVIHFMYSMDGRVQCVFANEVEANLSVGWYASKSDVTQTLYSMDGRTITVYKPEVAAYKQVGWYENKSDVTQTLYSADGRSITVYKFEVEAYKKVGWYESQAAAKESRPSGAYDVNGNVLKIGDTVHLSGLLNYFVAQVTNVGDGRVEIYPYDFREFLTGRSLLGPENQRHLGASAMVAGVSLNSKVWVDSSRVVKK